MSGRAKALAVGMSGVTALVVGAYLAGFLTLWLLELAIPLGPATYWQHLRALGLPQVAPYVGRIRLAGYLGFGVPLVAWTVLAILILKPLAPAFQGNARLPAGRTWPGPGCSSKAPTVFRKRILPPVELAAIAAPPPGESENVRG